MTKQVPSHVKAIAWSLMLWGGLTLSSNARAGVVTDSHGNTGYDTMAECDAAVAAGNARFYESYTFKPPLKRLGEADVKVMKLSELKTATEAAGKYGYNAADYAKGACDLGVGRSDGRDGVGPRLVGKYVPYSPDMTVNAYLDASGKIVRASMQQCDNNFNHGMPRPVGAAPVAKATVECYADVVTPAKFETRTEQVVKVPASKRYEIVPATYKSVSEEVLVKPEIKLYTPVPPTYKTVSEEVVVRPAGFREEPVPPTYKMVTEQIVAKPASVRLETIPATYKTVSEQVLVTPESKQIKVIPAVYGEKEEQVVDRPVTTRVETIPATYKTETEQVLVKAESLRYEPIALPLRTLKESSMRAEASARIEAGKETYKTVTEKVLVKEASKKLVPVPAVFETITERVKVADASREWKRGRAWVGKAIEMRPMRGFVVGPDGRVDGNRVEVMSAAGGRTTGVVDNKWTDSDNRNLDDDVMCLVEIPERYETITRQVLKTAATVREIEIPAEYATVSRQVLAQEASARTRDIPAVYQTYTRQEIDIEKLRALGYRFNEAGDIILTPAGERVLRAADVPGGKGASHPGPNPAWRVMFVRSRFPPNIRPSRARSWTSRPRRARWRFPEPAK